MNGLMMESQLVVTGILDHAARVFPAKEIISILPDRTRHQYSYAEFNKRCRKLSDALRSRLLVKKGDIVGTYAWNHYQHMELYYGIPGAGAICHTINIRLSPSQTEFIVNNAEDRFIFLDASLVPFFEKIAALLPTVEAYILINAGEQFNCSLPNYIHYEDLIADADENADWVNMDENEACAMCYTSGTTGLPKGVLYSHRSTCLHAMMISLPNYARLSSADRFLVAVPQFHVMAWGLPFGALLAGAALVLPAIHLQPEVLTRIIVDEKVNRASGVPTLWQGVYSVLKNLKPPTLHLKNILMGGISAPPSLMDNLKKDFDIDTVHAWGMTETSPVATLSRLQPEHESLSAGEKLRITALQGQELPFLQIRVITESGEVAPRDGMTVGEIQIRGPWIIQSYFKSNSRESFTEDGWFKTGDVGTLNTEGYMMITDRAKDLIKSGGEWISSVALEVTLMAHPKIKEAAVIAIPDQKWDERPLAAVVKKDDAGQILPEELQLFLSGSFAKYQIPDQYIFLESIPKTSVGKFDKKEMRRLYAEGMLR